MIIRSRPVSQRANAWSVVVLLTLFGIEMTAWAASEPGSVQALAGSQEPARPNVLVILVDNVPASLIGTYGNRYVRTPNIDSLADEGMTLERAFAVSGVCSPTRATLLTGLLPSQTGVHNALPSDVSIENWSAVGEFRSLPQSLRDAGYRTGLVGKYHLGTPDRPQMGFDYWVTDDSGHTSGFHDVTVIDNGDRYRTSQHITDFWTRSAVEFIETRDQSRPFFLLLSYNGPYMLPPMVLEPANNRHVDYYLANPVPLPRGPVHPYLVNFVRSFEGATEGGGEFLKGWRSDDKDQARRWSDVAWGFVKTLNNPVAMANAVSEMTMVDDGVGAVLASLKANGLDKDTLVIFTSDQGTSLGEHGLWGNSSGSLPTVAYDENMHVPLIAWHPGEIKAGGRRQELINQFDIAPTVLEYVGLADKKFANTPGRSFVPLMQGRTMQSHEAVYFEYMRTRAIRTEDWKLVKRLPDGPNELYDLRQDSSERQNLIDRPKVAAIQRTLNEKLHTFFETYANPAFDVWNGGSAKAVMEYGGRNEFYENYFPNWQPPTVRAEVPFSDDTSSR